MVHNQARQNHLQAAQTWEMEVGLGRKLHFPEGVLSSNLRLEIIMLWPEEKKVILVEKIVLWEEGREEAAERIKGKHQQLVQNCRVMGWTIWLLMAELDVEDSQPTLCQT